MTAYSLFPNFVELFYSTPFGQHTQTLPTNIYDPGADEFEIHSGGSMDAETMITDLLTPILGFYESTSAYTAYRIFSMASETAVPLLEKAATLTGQVGTGTSLGWKKAVQLTMTAIGISGTPGKIVLLDAGSNDNFDGVFSLPGSGSIHDLFTEWSNNSKGWRTRGNERPNLFLEVAKTLNEKLRREYRMF